MTDSPTATVIVPIHNALHAVRPCFDSLVRWTDLDRHRLLLINDASDDHTAALLREWAADHAGVELLENERNLGFVRTVNRGLAAADADHSVILNSDVCVTPRWLDKMSAGMESDRRIGVASPIANFAPHLRIEMLPGLGYLEMAALIEELAEPAYPDVTTPEGFCYMISGDCLRAIGDFDVMYGDGYGEESDFAMRANYFGYRTVCIDDTYVYHRGRASFGADRRDALYEHNKSVFHGRWRNRYPADFAAFQKRDPLAYLRSSLHRGSGYAAAFTR